MDEIIIKIPNFESNLLLFTSQFDIMKISLENLLKKVAELNDTCAINQYKIDGIEKMLAEMIVGYDKMKIIIENLPEECIKKIRKELDIIDEKKADKYDLNKKADMSQLLLKTDHEETSRINDFINNLDGKFNHNKIEFNDSLKALRTNYDKRLESLLQWILKQLKRLADRNNRDVTGTDIGG